MWWWSQAKKWGTGPSSSGPSNIWGNVGNIVQSPAFNAVEAVGLPMRATSGSAGLNLCSTTRLILTPKMGPQLIGTDFKGPLPPNTVGLLVGRSSVTMQGLVIHPGVIDSDFTGTVKIMASSPREVFAVSPGDRIAQLLNLPSCHGLFPSHNKQRENKRLGSVLRNTQ